MSTTLSQAMSSVGPSGVIEVDETARGTLGLDLAQPRDDRLLAVETTAVGRDRRVVASRRSGARDAGDELVARHREHASDHAYRVRATSRPFGPGRVRDLAVLPPSRPVSKPREHDSGRLDDGAVPLLGGLSGGAKDVAGPPPRDPLAPRGGDRLDDLALSTRRAIVARSRRCSSIGLSSPAFGS